jgi:cobaltochelatase CobN
MLTARRHPLAQVVVCRGCCCGRTDKGNPELPVDRLRAVWKEEGLGSAVHLTVSEGCLGPCELANVALLVTPDGAEWVGRMDGETVYEVTVGWARECKRAGRVPPLPPELAARRFTHLATPEGSA